MILNYKHESNAEGNFRQAYLYRQAHQYPTRDRDFWREAAKGMSDFVARFDEHPFAKNIIIACYRDIERELLEREATEPQQTRFNL